MNETLTGNLLVASSLATDPVYSRGVCLIVHQDESNVIGVMLNRPLKPSPEALIELLGEDSGPAKTPENRLTAYEPDPPVQADAELDAATSPENTAAQNSGDLGELGLDRDHTETTADPSPESEPQFQSDHQDQGNRSDQRLSVNESLFGMLHFGGPRSGPVVAIHQTSQFAEAETGDGIYVAAQRQHLEELVRDQPAPYRLIVGHLGWEHAELSKELEQGIWHTVPATTDAVFSAAEEMWPRLVRRATSSSMANWIGIRDLIGAGEMN